jgi:hypothetical protein
MTSALGKQYQLQSIQGLNNLSNWVTETSTVARTGTVVTLSAPASVAAKFFRIAISDVDSDGDGVNDWEEYKLSLNPTNALSNGQLDRNGQPMTDYAYATNKLASQNVITIAATDPVANQPDAGQSAINSGTFTVSRGGFPLTGITVLLGLGGPGPGFATENVDFLGLARSAILPAGVSSKTITVTPLANPNLLTPVIASMNILPNPSYIVGSASNASVVISPTATPNGTGLTGQYYTNANATYGNSANLNPANLKLTRVDPANGVGQPEHGCAARENLVSQKAVPLLPPLLGTPVEHRFQHPPVDVDLGLQTVDHVRFVRREKVGVIAQLRVHPLPHIVQPGKLALGITRVRFEQVIAHHGSGVITIGAQLIEKRIALAG